MISLFTYKANAYSPFQSLTHVVYDLAAYPELAVPLREEIEPIIAAEGWTRAALGKMWKLDSLLRESQRFHGIGIGTCAFVARASSLAWITWSLKSLDGT